jgi:hypothetical protein
MGTFVVFLSTLARGGELYFPNVHVVSPPQATKSTKTGNQTTNDRAGKPGKAGKGGNMNKEGSGCPGPNVLHVSSTAGDAAFFVSIPADYPVVQRCVHAM